jgi:hypothetical protein
MAKVWADRLQGGSAPARVFEATYTFGSGQKAAAVPAALQFKAGSCCDKAKQAGKDCSHPCCVAAAKAGKVCASCNG